MADTTYLITNVLRRIADFDWALYVEGRVPERVAVAELQERLQEVRRGLGARLPYLFLRYLVETHPDVFDIRVSVSRSLPRPITAENGRGVAEATAPQLCELLRRRNALAKRLGSPNYAALLLGSLQIGPGELAQWLAGLLAFVGPSVAPGTPWLEYHDEVLKATSEAEAQTRFSDETAAAWAGLLRVSATRLWTDVKTPAPVHGWCLAINRPDDVRLLLGPQGDLPLGLLLHEAGHYLHYTTPTPDQWQLQLPPPPFEEALACLLEMAAFLPAIRAQFGTLLTRPMRPETKRLHAAAQRRWAVGALFELQAYEADGEGLDGRWERIVRQAGFTPSFPCGWALDSFYLNDPVHRFSCVLGALWSMLELRRLAPTSLADVIQRIRDLARAGYEMPWRGALGIANSLPSVRPYLDFWQS
jgi:hypothetical protein